MKPDSLGGTDISKAEDQFKRERENKGNVKQDTSDNWNSERET